MIKLPKSTAELGEMINWKGIVHSAKILQESMVKEATEIKNKMAANAAEKKESSKKDDTK